MGAREAAGRNPLLQALAAVEGPEAGLRAPWLQAVMALGAEHSPSLQSSQVADWEAEGAVGVQRPQQPCPAFWQRNSREAGWAVVAAAAAERPWLACSREAGSVVAAGEAGRHPRAAWLLVGGSPAAG